METCEFENIDRIIRRRIARLLRGRSEHVQADAVQQSWLGVLQSIQRLGDSIRNLEALATMVTLYVAADVLRDQYPRRIKRTSLRKLDSFQSREPDPAAMTLLDDLQLTPSQSAVLNAYLAGGQDADAVAAALEIPLQRAYERISRLNRSIREQTKIAA